MAFDLVKDGLVNDEGKDDSKRKSDHFEFWKYWFFSGPEAEDSGKGMKETGNWDQFIFEKLC